MTNQDDVLITISPSPARRWFAVACLVALGILLIVLVARGAPNIVWQAVFLASAFGVLWGAKVMHAATDDCLELTRAEFRTGRGQVLSTIDNIKSVERGAFAFKPSNGFLVRLNEPQGQGWAPGLFWQRGRLIGVGGVISAGQSRAMAEMMSALKTDMSEYEDLFPTEDQDKK